MFKDYNTIIKTFRHEAQLCETLLQHKKGCSNNGWGGHHVKSVKLYESQVLFCILVMTIM